MTTRTEQGWEDRFKSWSGGPGDTELEQCDNAERMVRKAIAQCPIVSNMVTEVFAQGSFRNNTNIAQESDIDISVCLTETHDKFYCECAEPLNKYRITSIQRR